MKAMEAVFEQQISPYNPYIIRLDGKNFSKFTKGFKKPFDILFVNAMVETMNDLVNKYNAATGYTHSDEITLIFKSACTKEEYDSEESNSCHCFNGRVIKLCSVISGYCSVRFAHHLQNIMTFYANELPNEYSTSFIHRIEQADYCFDARPLEFSYEKPGEIVNHMIWRSIHDCQRNAISTFAHNKFGHKKMKGLDGRQMIEAMGEAGLDWDKDVPLFWKHGIYAKKELYILKTNRKGEEIECTRQRIVNKMFKITYSEEILEVLLGKYWPAPEILNELQIEDFVG